jgi:glutathione synthase/RimK-type ligase-like ATP-grasp enzyme
LRATSLIGKGLYGVDMKEKDGRFYVIEVNDNPNIDAGIEDKVLKDKLYSIIMEVFLNKIKTSK